MWMTNLEQGKYKYTEDYKDPYTGKKRYKSVTLTSKSAQAWNKAKKILDEKIEIAKNTKRDFKSISKFPQKYYPAEKGCK